MAIAPLAQDTVRATAPRECPRFAGGGRPSRSPRRVLRPARDERSGPSSALKAELVDLTPFATRLQLTELSETYRPAPGLVRVARDREQATSALGRRLGLEPPVFTAETALPLTVSTRTGDVR